MAATRTLIVYSSRYGQAEAIARRIGETVGGEVRFRDARSATSDDFDGCDSAVVVASVYFGKHSRAVTRFARRNRERLLARRSAFVSVSGAAGNPAARAEAEGYVELFVGKSGWRPARVEHVAGAAKFTKYNFLVRLVTKRSMAARGFHPDTRRDYEFTDWTAVERFARDFAA
jgi:menaquinone-dependent protoporphyrinogen oxidase